MDTTDMILAIIFTIFAIMGIVFTALQKRGLFKSFVIKTSDSFRLISTDGVTLLAILFGAYMVSYSSRMFAVLYAVILAGLFFFIKFSK